LLHLAANQDLPEFSASVPNVLWNCYSSHGNKNIYDSLSSWTMCVCALNQPCTVGGPKGMMAATAFRSLVILKCY